jgi:hypothetical protein
LILFCSHPQHDLSRALAQSSYSHWRFTLKQDPGELLSGASGQGSEGYPRVLRTYLDFEKPVAEIEAKIDELQALAEASGADAISQGVELSRLKT